MRITKAVVLGLALLSASGSGQLNTARHTFSGAVPAKDRGAFCSIVKKGLDAQKADDWATLYALLPPPHRETAESEESYSTAQKGRGWLLLDFRILRFDQVIEPQGVPENGRWDLLGCAQIRTAEKKTTTVQGLMTIYVINGEWYIDPVGLFFRTDPSSRCRLSEGKPLDAFCKNPGKAP